MSKYEERLKKLESRVSTVEREFDNSWASGSRSEYEHRFKSQVISQLTAKIWLILSGMGAAFGFGLFI